MVQFSILERLLFAGLGLLPLHCIKGQDLSPNESGFAFVNKHDMCCDKNAMLIFADFDSLSYKSFYLDGPITAIRAGNGGWVSVGFEDLTITNFKLTENNFDPISITDIKGKAAMATLEDSKIMDLQPVLDGKYLVVGYKYGLGIFDLMGGDIVRGFGNRYRSTSQLNFEAFGDIVLFKEDIGMNSSADANDSYTQAYLGWYKCKELSGRRRKSKLLRAWESSRAALSGNSFAINSLGVLKNPSGFSISESKKLICTYDSLGKIQILNLRKMELIIDTIFNQEIAKASFFSDDELIIAFKKGKIVKYRYKNKKSAMKELEPVFAGSSQISNVAFDEQNQVAFTMENKLFLMDTNSKLLRQLQMDFAVGYRLVDINILPNSSKVLLAFNK